MKIIGGIPPTSQFDEVDDGAERPDDPAAPNPPPKGRKDDGHVKQGQEDVVQLGVLDQVELAGIVEQADSGNEDGDQDLAVELGHCTSETTLKLCGVFGRR